MGRCRQGVDSLSWLLAIKRDLSMSSTANAWPGEQRRSLATTWVKPQWGVPEPRPTAKPAVNDEVVSRLVGRNLRSLRKRHRLSLEELARQSGVSRAMLGQVEQGKSIPSIKTLWQIAQVFGVSVSWFVEAGHGAQVLLLSPGTDSPATLQPGEGELRSLQQIGDKVRDAFYELRLTPGAILSLPASSSERRVNVVVACGTLLAEVDDTAHVIRTRDVLQYETSEQLIWRNAGQVDVLAYVVIRSAVKLD